MDPRGTVCQWDGQRVTELGSEEADGKCPISTLLAARPAWARKRAFAVYDPQTDRYYLTLPTDVDASDPDGVCYVYDFTTASWTYFTLQPAACALVASQVTTPGVYAGDTRQKTLYRLYGATDTAIRDESSIPWSWRSSAILAPSLQYKDVGRVVVTATRETADTLELAVYNNNTSGAYAGSMSGTPDEQHKLRWRLPLLPDCNSAQLKVYGNATADCAVAAIEARVVEKGRT
jgi:hypothetical protein